MWRKVNFLCSSLLRFLSVFALKNNSMQFSREASSSRELLVPASVSVLDYYSLLISIQQSQQHKAHWSSKQCICETSGNRPTEHSSSSTKRLLCSLGNNQKTGSSHRSESQSTHNHPLHEDLDSG